jgi:CubicO group peptidase (beta-lactamase class C family)
MDQHHFNLFWILLLAGLAAALALPRPAAAQIDSAARIDSGPLDLPAVDAFLSDSVRANHIPGLAAAMVQGDAVVFAQGYGAARAGEPVSAQTQFYIGSMSKSFTALAALQLVDAGKLDLDAPVQRYLPDFRVADPAASAQITVRHLLNHTSGLSDAGDPNAAAISASLADQARLLKDARLTAPVGTKFQYFNQNYRLLGRVIEQVSGQSFADYLQAHIFTPLGMTRTTADPAQARDLAQGYARAFGFPLPLAQVFNPGGVPSGYIVSTADDMARFLLAQIHNRRPDGQPLLSAPSLAVMRSTPAGIPSEYGMGWLVLENGAALAHGGSLDRFQAFMYFRPQDQRGFVMLCNQGSLENMLLETSAVRDGLVRLINGQPAQPAAYGWIGWALLALAAADLLNHLRLFRGLAGWARRVPAAKRGWAWARTALGVLAPAFLLFGLPWIMARVEGGAPDWSQPLSLQPDLVVWLLVGMSLTLLRSLARAALLLRRGEHTASQA